ncbi:transposase (plasmid) [Streptomyces viridifaciens]|nr:transposase [Streptomyces viridifaciens]
MERPAYPSDVTDEQWELVRPVIESWKQERVARSATGDPGSCDLREVVNAIFYQNRTGCQWRYLPHDLPPWSAVFYYFTLWRQDGLDQRIQELLRCQVRERAKRLEDPSLVIIDTQSVRAAAGVPKTTTGLDAGKKVPGRKRGLVVDVLGLITSNTRCAVSTTGRTSPTVPARPPTRPTRPPTSPTDASPAPQPNPSTPPSTAPASTPSPTTTAKPSATSPTTSTPPRCARS